MCSLVNTNVCCFKLRIISIYSCQCAVLCCAMYWVVFWAFCDDEWTIWVCVVHRFLTMTCAQQMPSFIHEHCIFVRCTMLCAPGWKFRQRETTSILICDRISVNMVLRFKIDILLLQHECDKRLTFQFFLVWTNVFFGLNYKSFIVTILEHWTDLETKWRKMYFWRKNGLNKTFCLKKKFNYFFYPISNWSRYYAVTLK